VAGKDLRIAVQLGSDPALAGSLAAIAEFVAADAGLDEPAQLSLGAAAVSAARDRFLELGAAAAAIEVRFEELAGRIEISYRFATGRRRTEIPRYPQVDAVESESRGGSDTVRLIKHTPA
jgi:hypothetical protein